MRKLRVVLVCIIVLFALPTLVSCEDNSQIIELENDQNLQATGHEEVGDPADDDDEEQG